MAEGERKTRPSAVNDAWVYQQFRLNLLVRTPDESLKQPWMTLWVDLYSRCVVGWQFSLQPNFTAAAERVDGVFEPFRGVPKTMYVDTGKDYRDSQWHEYVLIEKLREKGDRLARAMPYRLMHWTAKRVMERLDREWLQQLPGHLGAELSDDVHRREALTVEEFLTLWEGWILPEYHDLRADGEEMSPMMRYQRSVRNAERDEERENEKAPPAELPEAWETVYIDHGESTAITNKPMREE